MPGIPATLFGLVPYPGYGSTPNSVAGAPNSGISQPQQISGTNTGATSGTRPAGGQTTTGQ